MAKYKMAIIGYGGMGGWHHASVRDNVKSFEVVAAWDIREEARAKAIENGLHAYNSLEELLEDKEIDLVTIAVPNNFHKDLSIACLRSGKNVICEKPVTMNADELREIMQVQKETGKVFSIHQNRRWDRDYRCIRKIIEDGTIGKPYMLESRVQGSRRSMVGWRGHKVNGGGMVYDWGVHLIDQMLDLFDSPVTSISAHLFNIFSDGVDDNFKVLFRFENKVSALVEIDTNCFITQPRWHMSCTDGTAVIEDWDLNGKMVKLASDEQMTWDNDIVYTSAGPTRTMAPRPRETTEELALPEVNPQWSEYYENIAGVLDGTQELIVKPEQALRVMTVIDTIFESDRLGKPVECRI